jgi:hypothetical protein
VSARQRLLREKALGDSFCLPEQQRQAAQASPSRRPHSQHLYSNPQKCRLAFGARGAVSPRLCRHVGTTLLSCDRRCTAAVARNEGSAHRHYFFKQPLNDDVCAVQTSRLSQQRRHCLCTQSSCGLVGRVGRTRIDPSVTVQLLLNAVLRAQRSSAFLVSAPLTAPMFSKHELAVAGALQECPIEATGCRVAVIGGSFASASQCAGGDCGITFVSATPRTARERSVGRSRKGGHEHLRDDDSPQLLNNARPLRRERRDRRCQGSEAVTCVDKPIFQPRAFRRSARIAVLQACRDRAVTSPVLNRLRNSEVV